MNPIEIITRTDFRSFLKLQYKLFYRKPAILIFTFISIIAFIYGLAALLKPELGDSPIFPIVLGVVGIFVFPFSVWRGSKKAYESNKNLQEEIKYTFNRDTIEIKGETFNSSLSISSIYKFKETGNWIFLYHGKNIFNIIPRSSLSAEQLQQLRTLFK